PDYMQPAALVVLDAMPLMANGKLDRKALPSPTLIAAGERKASSNAEKAIAALFADVLALAEPPGADADFFALGGDSLLAVQLMVAIEQRLGMALGLGVLFSRPTVAGL